MYTKIMINPSNNYYQKKKEKLQKRLVKGTKIILKRKINKASI